MHKSFGLIPTGRLGKPASQHHVPKVVILVQKNDRKFKNKY